jgi:predicted metal-dependent phosphotriesterase family hydrolase
VSGWRKRQIKELQMENETTRKFPRTFTEAFPNSLENGAAIEIHVQHCSMAEKLIRVISLLGLIVVAMDCLVWRA